MADGTANVLLQCLIFFEEDSLPPLHVILYSLLQKFWETVSVNGDMEVFRISGGNENFGWWGLGVLPRLL